MAGRLLRFMNVKKTWNYLKKNGVKHTYYAAKERTSRELHDHYSYEEISDRELSRQREESQVFPYKFTILVPAYETDPGFLREMMESVLNQSYLNLELIIADAGTGKEVQGIVEEYQKNDSRIRYLYLENNKGISANTNKALQYATGDYIGLLDHDDILARNALYEVALAISEREKNKITVEMIYSDEDKYDGSNHRYFDLHMKPELNLDLVLSNNYICHFLVMKKELMQMLELRPAYDGAQDYDLVLRALHRIMGKPIPKGTPGGTTDEMSSGIPFGIPLGMEERQNDIRRLQEAVVHIPKVLYHWRSHDNSTADNPQSKQYAYEAGKRALEDFIRKRGWNGTVKHMLHLGFYRIEYIPDILKNRPEVGVVGGKLIDKNKKISGGIYKADGETVYAGLHKEYSGYQHRATVYQEAEAVDIRCMKVAPQLEEVMEEVIGLPYLKNQRTGMFYWRECIKKEADFKRISLQFCEKIKNRGYLIVWDPQMEERID